MRKVVGTGSGAVEAALRAAWSGADPGPADHAARPAPVPTCGDPARPLGRWPGGGIGALLDLALSADPGRRVGGVSLRRVPSAGGRYPVDAHVALDGGATGYDPLAHALYAPPPSGPGWTVRLTLAPDRTTWRYGRRSLPLLLLDLGHAVAAVRAASAATGAGATVTLARCAGGFPAATIRIGPASGPSPPPVSGPATADAAGPPARPADRQIVAALRSLAVPPVWVPSASSPVPARVLLARRSATWDEITRPGAEDLPPAVFDAARACRSGLVDTHVVTRKDNRTLLAALARHSAGQVRLADAAAILLVTATPDPDPPTVVARHLDAAEVVHAAWLAATAHGVPARPVGSWIDARLDGPQGRRRVTHALVLGGPAPPPTASRKPGPAVGCHATTERHDRTEP
ncbi:hypothetical protein CFP66_46415 [Pseudonocardia sp. MH-G8]|nr:hypothetical protein CFP66_46415 [Pseudonocardia sp. MH-G8]